MASTSEHLRASLSKAASNHSAKHPKAPAKKKVQRFTVTPADDGSGYAVDTHYHSGSGDEYMGPQTSVHKTLSSVHSHMKACCQDGDS